MRSASLNAFYGFAVGGAIVGLMALGLTEDVRWIVLAALSGGVAGACCLVLEAKT